LARLSQANPSPAPFELATLFAKDLPMPKIRVFDPAMCCSTGVCGPSIDPELARFAADVAWLTKQGVTIERFNLSQQPGAFASTPAVKEALARGNEVLPIILVDDRIAVEGAYPSRETLAALAGVVVRKLETLNLPDGGCCSPKGTNTKTSCC
jgi:hypothetical protein